MRYGSRAGLILADAAQDVRVRKRTVNSDDWDSRKWLDWFLDNHSTTPLVPMGVWKRKRFIVADYGENDELVGAMRAAYAMGGEEAALAILAAQLVSELPPGTTLPELPPDWSPGARYRYEEYRDPATRPQLWGTRTRDR